MRIVRKHDFYKKKMIMKKNPSKDKRIDSFTIHHNQIKNSSNPLVKTKINHTKTFLFTKNMEGKEEKQDQKKLNLQ